MNPAGLAGNAATSFIIKLVKRTQQIIKKFLSGKKKKFSLFHSFEKIFKTRRCDDALIKPPVCNEVLQFLVFIHIFFSFSSLFAP